MKNNKWVILILIVLVLVIGYSYRSQLRSMFGGSYTSAPTSLAPNMIMTKTDPQKGAYLVGPNGMTLYVFDKDQSNISNCSGNCLTIWPAYTTTTISSSLPTSLTVFVRSDGTMQYAYKNNPLYYYASDKKPGDILGDGVGGVWHLVKP